MGLSCGAKTAKLFLFIFNAIFFLCGVALLAVGIWIVVDQSGLVSIASKALGDNSVVTNNLDGGSLVKTGAYVLIGVGAFNFLVGFCGCCGACTENKCLLGVYAALIGFIMIIEIVGAILAGVFHSKVEANLLKGLVLVQNASYLGFPKGTDNAVSTALDLVMIKMKCCGVNNYTDFTVNYKDNADQWYSAGRNYTSGLMLKIPYSCCAMKDTKFIETATTYKDIQANLKDPNCGKTVPTDTTMYHKQGCYPAIKDKVVQYAVVLIAIAIVIILIELFGIILSCCLIRAIDE